MRLVEIIISSKTGTEPPTKPVFPPCGQTANLSLLQNDRIFETSSVVFGLKTHLLKPLITKFKKSFN